jgi:hypothetical protein
LHGSSGGATPDAGLAAGLFQVAEKITGDRIAGLT